MPLSLDLVHGSKLILRLNVRLISVKRSVQPSPARMEMDNPQVPMLEYKDLNSRSCTPASQHSVVRMDGSACRVSNYSSLKRLCHHSSSVTLKAERHIYISRNPQIMLQICLKLLY